MKTRAIAYLRVSTDKQADTGVSLDVQRQKVAAYAGLYDLDLVSIEADAGESAKSLQRPALDRAMKALEDGEADALLVVKLDRLTRSVRDLGELVDKSNREGWALLSVSEQLDTRTAAGRMVLNILTGGEPPYGWQVSDDGVRLDPHEGEQAAIEAASELRQAGLSLRKIGRLLESKGLLPRTGKSWHPEKVKRLLKSAA